MIVPGHPFISHQIVSVPELVTVPVPVLPNTPVLGIESQHGQPTSLTADVDRRTNSIVPAEVTTVASVVNADQVISLINADLLSAWSHRFLFLNGRYISETHGVASIFPSFANCRQLSDYLKVASRYLIRLDVPAANAAATVAIHEGRGLDRQLMHAQMAEIKDVGLRNFLEQKSATLSRQTLQLKPEDAPTNSGRYHLPITDAQPGRYEHVDLTGRAISLLQDHITGSNKVFQTPAEPGVAIDPFEAMRQTDPDFRPVLPVGLPPMPQELAGFTTGTVSSCLISSDGNPKFSFESLAESMLLTNNAFQNIQSLARDGGYIILAPSMKLNHGEGMASFPAELAPQGPIQIHFAKDVANGHGVILPVKFWQEACADAHLPLHGNNPQIAYQKDKVLGRQCSNLTHPKGSSLNSDSKKRILAAVNVPVTTPRLSDLCQVILNGIAVFGIACIMVCRIDIRAAFTRIRILPAHVPLCALYFKDENGEEFFFCPLSNRFGSQDSNYQWHAVATELENQSNDRQLGAYGTELTTFIIDDFVVAGSQESLSLEIAAITADAIERIGPSPISEEKTLLDHRIEISGNFFNCRSRTVGISESIFSKMVCVFILQLPWEIPNNFRVEVEFLQRMQSYALSGANIMLALKSFSRGFSANLRQHSSPPTETVALSERSIVDIWIWRIVLLLTLHDVRWITVSLDIPILFQRQPGETLVMQALRQAKSAHYVLYGDACTNSNGLGVYAKDVGWSKYQLTELDSYISADGVQQPVDINVLEFIAAILSLVMLVEHLQRRGVSTHGLHIHVFSDNTSCLSWMRRHRADHPLHMFLLHMFSFIQVRFGLIVTVGHIPGVINIYADAASRDFECSDGKEIRSQLQNQLPLFPVPISFMRDIVKAATQPCSSTWQLALDALMVLDNATGLPSADPARSTTV